MKRSAPLRRSTPLRRNSSRPRTRRPSTYRRRPRDLAYMQFVRTLPCAARELSRCGGGPQADHAGRRGLGQKCADTETISLCALHHMQRTDFSGPFRSWDQAAMRSWLAEQVANTQAHARARGLL